MKSFSMSSVSRLRRGASLAGAALGLALEAGKVGALYLTQREASAKAFRRALVEENLPAQAVRELSKAYRSGQIHLREIVRGRGLR